MGKWVLLLLTIVMGWMTFDAYKWRGSVGRVPFQVISHFWKGGLQHLPLAERNRIRDQYASRWMGAVDLFWLMVVVTLGFAWLTFKAFME